MIACKNQKNIYLPLSLLLLVFSSIGLPFQPHLTSVQQIIKQHKLNQGQILNLILSQPIKIQLIINNYQQFQKVYYRRNQYQKSIGNFQILQNYQLNQQWNVSITIKIIQGIAQYYLIEKKNDQSLTKLIATLKKGKNNVDIVKKNHQFIEQHFQLKQGINIISLVKLKQYRQRLSQNSKLIIKDFSILCIPNTIAKVLIRLGNIDRTIHPIKMQQSINIISNVNEINSKVYKLIVKDSYAIRFIRKKGFPVITLFQCPKNEQQCYDEVHEIPRTIESEQTKYLVPPNYRKFMIESMLTKSQEYVGKKHEDSELYLQIQAKQQNEAQVQVNIQPPTSIMQLKQNQILKQDLVNGTSKKYSINFNTQQQVRISVQVYEGQTSIVVKEVKGNWSYIPLQTTGVILIDVPIALKTKTLLLEIKASGKDTTYIVVYSQGQYQIFMRDGYPTTHVLNPQQNISFFYHNEQVRNNPIYLSFNLNKPKSITNLQMRIYYYNQLTNTKQQRIQYKPMKSIQQLQKQANSIVLQIAGNYPKLQIYFFNSWYEDVQIALTINDQQIIFLPLYHNLPLQIYKDGGLNLLIDNNQQGYIQLIIKKCDQSFPQIAYSLSPQDFMRKIYDYQSLGQSQRVTKSTIKVKKGGGLYIRITGDQITNSFIQISARYMQKDRKKLVQNSQVKRGNHGELNYQLITNSKAQVWFKQVQCSSECKKSFKYQCYLSTFRSDLFREMICPGVFMFTKQHKQGIQTKSYHIQSKPDNHGIIAFHQIINHPIQFLSVKGKYQDEEIIYQDIEIVTFSGQISRMSTQFLLVSIGIVTVVAIFLFIVIRRQARVGYIAISSFEQRENKRKRQIIKSV